MVGCRVGLGLGSRLGLLGTFCGSAGNCSFMEIDCDCCMKGRGYRKVENLDK